MSASPGAIDQQRSGMPAARAAGDVLGGGVADVEGLAARSSRRSRSAGSKIAGSGLRTPTPAEVTTPSSAPPSPQRASTSGSDTSQFDTQTSLRPEPAKLGQRRRRVVEGPEADRGHHRLDRDLASELAREHRGAAGAQLRQRVGVASLVAVLPVVGHLGAHGARPGGRRARRRAPPPGAARAARARPGCRARRAARRGAGHGAGSWEHSHGGTRPRSAGRVTLCFRTQSFWQQHGDLISAVITMAVAIAIAFAVDRLVIARAGHVAGRVTEVTASRAPPQTRLRLIRRLVFVVILLIGAALALSNFAKIQRLATGILASSAVLGLVIGFAARQTIANMVAGHHDRDHAADPDRRHGDDRGRDRPGRRPHALLHLPRPRRRAPCRGPEREGRRPGSCSITRPAIARRRPPSRSGCRPAADLEQARRRAEAGGRRRGDRRGDDPRGGSDRAQGPRDHERTQVGDEEARSARERPRGAARRRASWRASSAGSRLRASYPFRAPRNDSASTQDGIAARGGPYVGRSWWRSASSSPRSRSVVGGVRPTRCSVWDKTPALGHLKPIKEGSTSVVFAADGSRLGYIQSDTIRHPVDSNEDPQPPPARHGGDRGQELLRARRGRLHLHRAGGWADLKAGSAVQGGSTITQQLVRNLYIAHPQEDHRSQDRGGEAGDRVRAEVLEEPDPHQVPEHGLLRDHRRTHRGRRAGRRGDLLRQGASVEPRPAARRR